MAISRGVKGSKQISLSGLLREEIETWSFVDEWVQGLKWRSEGHIQLNVATDASLFAWAGVITDGPGKGTEIHDYCGVWGIFMYKLNCYIFNMCGITD